MNTRYLLVLAACAVLCACACNKEPDTPDVPDDPQPVSNTWPEAGMKDATYISNGEVQIGVDLNRGGAIFHFSESGTKRNLLNHYDEGRFVQQSYYGDSDGSNWNGTPWNWNPVQGGSWQGQKAEVIYKEITEDKIIVHTTPRHWATGESLTNCVMKEEITLQGKYAKVHYTFEYSGSASYKKRHQEMPAVFCDYALGNLVYYSGSKAWTGAAVTKKVPGNLSEGATNQYVTRTEEWSAYVDANDWGIGVYTPGTKEITYYTFGSGSGGARASACSYFAPIRTLAITSGLKLNYDVYITIGTVDEIRSRFDGIRKGL